MKRLALIAMTAMALSAHAEFVAQDTAPSTSHPVSTVREAKTEFGDDAHIVLEGYITGTAGTINPEEYFFKDDTDTIKVEINPDVWRGQKSDAANQSAHCRRGGCQPLQQYARNRSAPFGYS